MARVVSSGRPCSPPIVQEYKQFRCDPFVRLLVLVSDLTP
jgi:hypothetical protein